MPNVPEGIDLTWPVITFLGALCVGVFLVSWRIFSVRNADHVKIAKDLNDVKVALETKIAENKESLDEKITTNKTEMTDKIEGKCDAIKKEIDRNERDNDEQYKELHGRMNRGTDELSGVRGDMREVRGEMKVISTIVIDGTKK